MSEHGTAELQRRTAEDAEARCDWRAAVDAYESALTIVSQSTDGAGPDEAALLTGLGRCNWNLSEARTAWRSLRRAIAICQERGDAVGQARATVEILRIWGPPDRHKMMAEEALDALGDADPYLRARLLMALGRPDHGERERYEEALVIAEEHGFQDLLAVPAHDSAWDSMAAGEIDEAIQRFEKAHTMYAGRKVYDAAAGVLRNAGYNVLQAGRLDEGYGLAERSFAYASRVNLLFNAQLALMDMVGVAFARGEFERCEQLLAGSPGDSDFRGDLFRLWIAEERGDFNSALRLMVDPERGGKAPTAVGQIHAAAAGVLYRAGNQAAAEQALRAWASVDRPGAEPEWTEVPAALECLVGLGDDALLRRVHDAFAHRDRDVKAPARYSTLQGRAVAPARGAVSLRLGLLDEAERHYHDGLAWCERERCARDAERCRAGLARVASARQP